MFCMYCCLGRFAFRLEFHDKWKIHQRNCKAAHQVCLHWMPTIKWALWYSLLVLPAHFAPASFFMLSFPHAPVSSCQIPMMQGSIKMKKGLSFFFLLLHPFKGVGLPHLLWNTKFSEKLLKVLKNIHPQSPKIKKNWCCSTKRVL